MSVAGAAQNSERHADPSASGPRLLSRLHVGANLCYITLVVSQFHLIVFTSCRKGAQQMDPSNYRDLDLSPRILLGPGPSMVAPRVLRAMAMPCIGHLDPEFLHVMNEVQE